MLCLGRLPLHAANASDCMLSVCLLGFIQLYQLPGPSLTYDCSQMHILSWKPLCVLFSELLVNLGCYTALMGSSYALYSYTQESVHFILWSLFESASYIVQAIAAIQ